MSIASPIFYVLLMAAFLAVGEAIARCIPFYANETSTSAATRFRSIDGLRGLLAFGVFFHHARLTWQFHTSPHKSWSAPEHGLYHVLGPVSVAFFFCITAFLFWGKAMAARGEMVPLRLFENRFRRLAPMYWVSLAMIGAVVLLCFKPVLPAHSGYLALRILPSLIAGMFGLPDVTLDGIQVNLVNAGVYWTLQYEWGFYLALPLLAWALKRTSIFLGFAALFISLALLFPSTVFPSLSPFVVGMVAARLITEWPEVRWLRSGYISIASVLLLLALPRLVRADFAGGNPSLWTTPATLLIALPFIAIAYGNNVFGLLSLAGARFLGTISYSVYLLHGIVLFVGMRWLNSLYPLRQMSPVVYWAFAGAGGVLTLLLSALTYRFIEFPWLKSRRPDPRLSVSEQVTSLPLTPEVRAS